MTAKGSSRAAPPPSKDTVAGKMKEKEEVEEDQEIQEATEPKNSIAITTSSTPTLSKSWEIASRHVPTFTGGKISHSSSCDKPFLLLPVTGDLCLVDAQRGTLVTSVRGLASTNSSSTTNSSNNDDHDDDREVDMDAITTHALSHQDDKILITCSHNLILRQYEISRVNQNSTNGNGNHNNTEFSIVLTKSWGKSGHSLPVNEMAFHFSNVFLATGSVDGTCRIFDTRGGFVTHVFRPFESKQGGGSGRLSVTALSWIPDARQLIVGIGRDDGSIAIHNLRDGGTNVAKHAIYLHDHVSAVSVLQWALPIGTNLFVSASRDAVVNVWKIEEKRRVSSKTKSLQKKTTGNSNNGSLATNSTIQKYTRVQTVPMYEPVEGMVVLPPSNKKIQKVTMATAGGKGRVRLWSTFVDNPKLVLLDEQPLEESFGQERGGYLRLISTTMTTDKSHDTEEHVSQQLQLIVADAEHNITFLPLNDNNDKEGDDNRPRLSNLRTIVGYNDDILDLKVIPTPTSSDGDEELQQPQHQRIVVATNSAQVRLFDLESFSCHVLDRHSATVLCVDVSPCLRYIATCGKDKTMRLWHANRLQCIAVAVGHSEAVGSTAFSRQARRFEVKGKAAVNGGGSFCVTVSVDRTLKRWNLPGAEALEQAAVQGEEIALKSFASARAHEKDINVVTVAPNDSLIATGSQDKTIKLWKATDLSLHATLTGHRRGVWDCQFSPHDRVLASASGDRTIKLWSLADYTCVRTFQGHTSSVLRVRFLSFGLQLASSGADGLVKIWTIRTNECETTLDGHSDKAWALDMTKGGKTMVSGGADSRILVWTDTTQQEEEAKNAKREEAMMLDQKLVNHLRHKEYRQALEITLELDKPHQALRVFSAIIESNIQGGNDGIGPLQSLVRSWSKDKLVRVLQYCREWNTRSRNAHVALLVVRAVVSSIPIHDLVSIDGVPEIMAGIMPYAERHFERLDRLHESCFLLDYVLCSMGNLESTDNLDADFAKWEASSKLVLPPVGADGRIQVGGKTLVGSAMVQNKGNNVDNDDDEDEIMTVGESSSDEDDDSSSDVSNSETGEKEEGKKDTAVPQDGPDDSASSSDSS